MSDAEPILRQLGSLASRISKSKDNVPVQLLSLRLSAITRMVAAANKAEKLSEYSGSLTTPPCTEGVQWLVSEVPLFVDPESYKQFRKTMKFNARLPGAELGQPNALESVCASKGFPS